MSERAEFPTTDRLAPPYTQPHQARRHAPTDYENLLGDAIEAAFAAGAWKLEELVARLNQDSIRTPEGDAWTVDGFKAAIAQLADR